MNSQEKNHYFFPKYLKPTLLSEKYEHLFTYLVRVGEEKPGNKEEVAGYYSGDHQTIAMVHLGYFHVANNDWHLPLK